MMHRFQRARTSERSRLRVMTIVDARRFGNRVFRWLSYSSLAMAGLSVWVIRDPWVAGLSVICNLTMALLNRLSMFRRLPAAILISFNLFVFLSIPLCYIGYRGAEYSFVERFSAPGDNETYLEALPGAIVALLVYVPVLLAGLGLGHGLTARFRTVAVRGSWRRGVWSLSALAFVVAYVSVADSASFFATISQGTSRVQAILPLIFLDHAFLLLFPFLLYGPAPTVAQLKRYAPQLTFILVLVLFMTVFVSATSKAAILNLSWYLFIFPLAFFYASGGRIYWPSRFLVIVAGATAVPMFFLAQAQRQAKMTGSDLRIGELAAFVFDEARSGYAQALTTVADRISASLHSYVMIHSRFSDTYDWPYAKEYAAYLLKSFANLVWLGTPFPEAYFPSSQLLASVLAKSPLVGFGDSASFWAQANTQPYSGFGACLILFGPLWSVPVLFCLGVLFSVLFNTAPHRVVQLCLLFLVNAFVQMYGVESTAQVALHLAVASGCMLVLLKLTRFRFDAARPLDHAPPGAVEGTVS